MLRVSDAWFLSKTPNPRFCCKKGLFTVKSKGPKVTMADVEDDLTNYPVCFEAYEENSGHV